MNTVFPIRLKNARKMRNLSYRSLSEAMGNAISSTALAKYEKGQMFPSSKIVIQLAAALGVSIDDLFRPFSIEIDLSNVKYRKGSKLGIKEQDAINHKAAIHLEKYIEVERMCGENVEFTTKFPEIIVRNESDACAVAARFRERFQLGMAPISSPIELLESVGAKIIEIEDAPDKFDGDTFTTDGIFVIVLNKTIPSERKRFSLFHETGHKVMTFAEGVKDIQVQYGISVEAMMKKACQMGIISENRYKTFCIKVKSNKSFQAKVREERFPKETSNRFNRLVFKLLASEEITESKCASLLGCSVEEVRKRLMLL